MINLFQAQSVRGGHISFTIRQIKIWYIFTEKLRIKIAIYDTRAHREGYASPKFQVLSNIILFKYISIYEIACMAWFHKLQQK